MFIPFRLRRHSRCWRSRRADQSRRSTLQKIDARISISRNRVAEAKLAPWAVASRAHFPRSAGSTNVASSSSSDTRTHCMRCVHRRRVREQNAKKELERTRGNGQGGFWIRTVRPLLTRALTNTSLDSTSSFFCSSPCHMPSLAPS